MKKTLIATVMLSAGFAFAGLASAATTWTELTSLTNPSWDGADEVTFAVTTGNHTNYYTTTFDPDAVWAGYATNLPQSGDLANIESQFNVDVDTVQSNGSLAGETDWSFTALGDIEFVSLHFGNNDLLLRFADDVLKYGSVFSVHLGKWGMSGYGAYGDVSSVPLPGAAWLFGSALLGFMAVANRRRV